MRSNHPRHAQQWAPGGLTIFGGDRERGFKQEWHTINGTKRDAQIFERQQKTRLASRVYIAKAERRTFAEVAAMFIKERQSRARRAGTVYVYQNVLKRHLLPEFGVREVGTIRRSDVADHFNGMRERGASVQTVNRALRTMKAVLFFALERELVERNVMQRFRPFEGGKDERHVSRGAFTEAEVQAILDAARPSERALIGLLCLTDLRPGEAYALDRTAVDLGQAICEFRSWDHRGQTFELTLCSAGGEIGGPCRDRTYDQEIKRRIRADFKLIEHRRA